MARKKVIPALAALSLIAVSEAAAAGWRTVVTDHPDGIRSAGLIGAAGEDETQSIVVSCAADSDLPPLLWVLSTPSGDYAARPGDDLIIDLSGLQLTGTIRRNDSAGAAAWVELTESDLVLGRIATSDPLVITATIGSSAIRMAIPGEGLAEAMDDLRVACGLH